MSETHGTHEAFLTFLGVRWLSCVDKKIHSRICFDRILPDVSLLFWTMGGCVQHRAVSHFAVLDVYLDRPWDAGPSGCVFHRSNQRDHLWDRGGHIRLDFVRPYRKVP
jgi:hypothetical protein